MAEFELHGGVRKPSTHKLEKFFLFFIVDGKEYSLFELIKNGLVTRLTEHGPGYTTGLVYGKLFLYESGYGFGVQRRFHSFYFQLQDSGDVVTVRSFGGLESPYYFRGRIKFLKKADALDLLNDKETSKNFLKQQSPLSVEVVRALIDVERDIPKDVRHIKIGAKTDLGGI